MLGAGFQTLLGSNLPHQDFSLRFAGPSLCVCTAPGCSEHSLPLVGYQQPQWVFTIHFLQISVLLSSSWSTIDASSSICDGAYPQHCCHCSILAKKHGKENKQTNKNRSGWRFWCSYLKLDYSYNCLHWWVLVILASKRLLSSALSRSD